MAKEVTHAVTFPDPAQLSLGPTKLLLVLACDDGSIYEFQRHEDSPSWNLKSRGSRDEPPATWSDSKAPLPGDVKDTLDDVTEDVLWAK